MKAYAGVLVERARTGTHGARTIYLHTVCIVRLHLELVVRKP